MTRDEQAARAEAQAILDTFRGYLADHTLDEALQVTQRRITKALLTRERAARGRRSA